MSKIGDWVFFRNQCVCPRWFCFTFDNYFRKLLHNPDKIVKPYIKEGYTVLDVGPGIGYFTIPMAGMVGDRGRVIAADIQEEMLAAIKKRALRAGLQHRIKLQLGLADSLDAENKADFILAFWMVHEVPDQQKFFAQLYALLKDDGKFLMVEPRIHVTNKQFNAAIKEAKAVGFKLNDQPAIAISYSAVFTKA